MLVDSAPQLRCPIKIEMFISICETWLHCSADSMSIIDCILTMRIEIVTGPAITKTFARLFVSKYVYVYTCTIALIFRKEEIRIACSFSSLPGWLETLHALSLDYNGQKLLVPILRINPPASLPCGPGTTTPILLGCNSQPAPA